VLLWISRSDLKGCAEVENHVTVALLWHFGNDGMCTQGSTILRTCKREGWAWQCDTTICLVTYSWLMGYQRHWDTWWMSSEHSYGPMLCSSKLCASSHFFWTFQRDVGVLFSYFYRNLPVMYLCTGIAIRVSDPDWIRIHLGGKSGFRLKIRIHIRNPDLDPGRPKLAPEKGKNWRNFMFEESEHPL
jgi:hypothetical protein